MCEPNHQTIRQNSYVVKRGSVYTNQYQKNQTYGAEMQSNYCAWYLRRLTPMLWCSQWISNMSYEMFEISKVWRIKLTSNSVKVHVTTECQIVATKWYMSDKLILSSIYIHVKMSFICTVMYLYHQNLIAVISTGIYLMYCHQNSMSYN